MIANPKQGVSIRSYLLHSSLAGVRLCCVFYQPAKLCKNGEPKPFCGAYFDFSSSNFNLQGQILVLSAIVFQNTHTHNVLVYRYVCTCECITGMCNCKHTTL
jgi:hypothetical protein